MNKKIIVILVMMLLILTTVLPIVSSINTNISMQTSTKIAVDNKCNECNEIHDTHGEDSFPQCVVMNNPFIGLDSNSASPKPIIVDTPDEFSWKNNNGQDWTTSGKYQGNCGSCWDFAAIGTLESIINIREGCATLDSDLSEQYVLSCLPDAGSCWGGSTYAALLYMMETSSKGNYHNGALLEECFPYQADDDVPCDDKCPDWEDKLVPILDCGYWHTHGTHEDREAIKTQVMESGPVAVGMMATGDFKEWGRTHHNPDDYYPYPGSVDWTNHAVVLVGWKDDPSIGNGGYWIVKNSWSIFWGYEGFFNIEYGSLNIDSSGVVWVNYDPESVDWSTVADAGGLYFGDVGQEITFNASRSFAEGDMLSYYWDFGDETTGTGVSPTHAYLQRGIYPVTLTVTDSEDNSATDTTWAGIEESIDPPNKPTIDGPTSGNAGTTYEYTFTATDPNGDSVYYYINWGDCTVEEGLGPFLSDEMVNVSHTWTAQGNYQIRAKAKDIYGAESPWSLPLSVTMPRNKISTNTLFLRFLERLEGLLERFPNLFPILHKILLLQQLGLQ